MDVFWKTFYLLSNPVSVSVRDDEDKSLATSTKLQLFEFLGYLEDTVHSSSQILRK
jgi:hypothetical protein